MFIVTIDCGTTNSRLYVVDENGIVISNVSRKIGIRDVAVHCNNQVLRYGLREMFDRALRKAGISIEEIHCILASGVITSELGLVELPHLWAPCTLDTLAVNITCVKDLNVFPQSIPVYFVRGIKNFYDPSKVSIQDIRTLDLMRGEETQVAGLLNNKEIKLPTIVIILSSHTKLIPIDEEMRILGSITTLSGQLYEVVSKGTLIKKSIKKENNFNNTNYFNPDVFNIAYNEVIKSGFLRGLMCVRLLDILVHANWFDRKLFIESLFAAEDMCAINQVQELMNLSSTNFILIGVKSRCSIYKYLLETKISPECNVSMITDKAEIDQLSIQGVLSLAKKAGIF